MPESVLEGPLIKLPVQEAYWRKARRQWSSKLDQAMTVCLLNSFTYDQCRCLKTEARGIMVSWLGTHD